MAARVLNWHPQCLYTNKKKLFYSLLFSILLLTLISVAPFRIESVHSDHPPQPLTSRPPQQAACVRTGSQSAEVEVPDHAYEKAKPRPVDTRLLIPTSNRTYTFQNTDQVFPGMTSAGGMLSMYVLSAIQHEHGVFGDVAEIGVHHGKFSISLSHTLHTIESFLAVDLFSRQYQNVDGSGHGSLPIFLHNMAVHGVPREYMSTIESSSTELQPHQLREVDGKKLGCFRMFSIDGGHTEEITLSDMVLVQKVLCEGGVIIVDDWVNDEWPGVRSGVFRHFFSKDPAYPPLAPLMAIHNKLYLTTPSHHEHYFTSLGSSLLNHSITYLPHKTDLNGFKLWSRVEAFASEWDLEKMWNGYLGSDGGEHWRWGE